MNLAKPDQTEFDILDNTELFAWRDFFRGELAGLSKRIADGEIVGFRALKLERLLKINLGMVMTAIGKRFRRKKRAVKDEKGQPNALPDTTQITIAEGRVQLHQKPVRFRPENREMALRYN